MVTIPQNVLDAMKSGAKVLATADKNGNPHVITAGTIVSPQPDKMMIGEVLMKKTAANLAENPKATFLVISGMESYSIEVCNAVRITEGPALDEMNKQIAAMHLVASAVWMFDVAAVYDQGASPKAGTKIA